MKRSCTQLLNLFFWFCLVLVSLSGQSSAFQTGVHWKDSESSARSHDFKAGFGSATAGSLTGLLSRDIGTLRGLSSEELKNSASQLSANISQVSAGLLGADPNLGRQIGENVWEFNDRRGIIAIDPETKIKSTQEAIKTALARLASGDLSPLEKRRVQYFIAVQQEDLQYYRAVESGTAKEFIAAKKAEIAQEEARIADERIYLGQSGGENIYLLNPFKEEGKTALVNGAGGAADGLVDIINDTIRETGGLVLSGADLYLNHELGRIGVDSRIDSSSAYTSQFAEDFSPFSVFGFSDGTSRAYQANREFGQAAGTVATIATPSTQASGWFARLGQWTGLRPKASIRGAGDLVRLPEGGGVIAPNRLPHFVSQGQFDDASALLRASGLSDDIVIQGSRVSGTSFKTGKAVTSGSDIDIAIMLNEKAFNQQIVKAFGSKKFGTADGRTMLHAIDNGKITSGRAGLRSLRKQLEGVFGTKVDLSIIQRGGKFDNGAQLPIR